MEEDINGWLVAAHWLLVAIAIVAFNICYFGITTDLGEASALREERKWNGYKRYYDPPRSRRDRALGR